MIFKKHNLLGAIYIKNMATFESPNSSVLSGRLIILVVSAMPLHW